jgi:hypothetical protein
VIPFLAAAAMVVGIAIGAVIGFLRTPPPPPVKIVYCYGEAACRHLREASRSEAADAGPAPPADSGFSP